MPGPGSPCCLEQRKQQQMRGLGRVRVVTAIPVVVIIVSLSRASSKCTTYRANPVIRKNQTKNHRCSRHPTGVQERPKCLTPEPAVYSSRTSTPRAMPGNAVRETELSLSLARSRPMTIVTRKSKGRRQAEAGMSIASGDGDLHPCPHAADAVLTPRAGAPNRGPAADPTVPSPGPARGHAHCRTGTPCLEGRICERVSLWFATPVLSAQQRGHSGDLDAPSSGLHPQSPPSGSAPRPGGTGGAILSPP